MIKLLINFMTGTLIITVVFSVLYFWIVPGLIDRYRRYMQAKKSYDEEVKGIEENYDTEDKHEV